ncbi:MAG: hypothetical protein H0Z40_01585 [Desulfotomaculum sp.]|nr:hypothetical protein [Desulfotomaculum sp.]
MATSKEEMERDIEKIKRLCDAFKGRKEERSMRQVLRQICSYTAKYMIE